MPETYAKLHPENNIDFIPRFIEGEYEIPFIMSEEYEPALFLPFGSTPLYNRYEYGIHFFVSDYRFQGLWSNRDKYASMFQQCKAVMTPDYSMYTNWPVMVQMWNHYRKHVIGAWMQSIGCKVYPTINWSDERSYKWCFDGEPWRSTVCVSSVGTQNNKESKRLFMLGYDKMMEVLEPQTILFHGIIPKECTGNIVPVEVFTKRFKEMRK